MSSQGLVEKKNRLSVRMFYLQLQCKQCGVDTAPALVEMGAFFVLSERTENASEIHPASHGVQFVRPFFL